MAAGVGRALSCVFKFVCLSAVQHPRAKTKKRFDLTQMMVETWSLADPRQ